MLFYPLDFLAFRLERKGSVIIMKELFKLSPEELSKICIKAEFDEKYQLIINKENCIHEDNIIFFKKPILISYGDLLLSVLDHTAIVEENREGVLLFLFAIAETEKYRDTLENFYDTHHCDQYDCFGVDCYRTGWEEYDIMYV